MEFNTPPPNAVLQILVDKARLDPRLAAQIEAAQWQAIAMIAQQEQQEVDTPDDGSDG